MSAFDEINQYFCFFVYGFLTAVEDIIHTLFNHLRGIPDMSFFREQAVRECDRSSTMNHVAIITGGNRGIGLETCVQLLRVGYKVVIGCRDVDGCQKAIEKLKEEFMRNKLPDPDVKIYYLDLMNLDSVRSFCSRIKGEDLPVNLILNNAGVMFIPLQLTKEGIEGHFCVNHLGHFCLNLELLPLLIKNGPSRIIVLTSGTYSYGKFDYSLVQGCNYHRWWAYCNSKFCNLLYGLSLSRKIEQVGLGDILKVFIIHPGSVGTDIVLNSKAHPWISKLYSSSFVKTIACLRTPLDGCSGPVYAALSREAIEYSGRYLYATFPTPLKPVAQNSEDEQEKLWSYSEDLTNLNFHQIIDSIK